MKLPQLDEVWGFRMAETKEEGVYVAFYYEEGDIICDGHLEPFSDELNRAKLFIIQLVCKSW